MAPRTASLEELVCSGSGATARVSPPFLLACLHFIIFRLHLLHFCLPALKIISCLPDCNFVLASELDRGRRAEACVCCIASVLELRVVNAVCVHVQHLPYATLENRHYQIEARFPGRHYPNKRPHHVRLLVARDRRLPCDFASSANYHLIMCDWLLHAGSR